MPIGAEQQLSPSRSAVGVVAVGPLTNPKFRRHPFVAARSVILLGPSRGDKHCEVCLQRLGNHGLACLIKGALPSR